MTSLIRQLALESGFDDCKVTSAAAPATAEAFQRWLALGQHGEMAYLQRNAHKRVDPRQVLPGARSIVTLAASYALRDGAQERSTRNWVERSKGLTTTISGQSASEAEGRQEGFAATGVFARYARFADYHDVLTDRLRTLTRRLDELGGPGTRSLWYIDTGPLLERDLGQRAGLGFVGKHTNLISRRLGNWFFLAEIITTLELEPDAPERNRCGTCARCLEACPTGAITRPFQLDARRCISYLTIELKGPIPVELRQAVGNRVYGCDDCLAACPWNRFARAGRLMREHARPELGTPDLIELLSVDEAEFRRRFSGTPILRTKRRGLLRNVCVALGNSGDARCLSALARAVADPEQLIAEHARWAVQQIEGRLAKQSSGVLQNPPVTPEAAVE